MYGQGVRGPCAMGPSPSVDNAVSYTSLLRLIKNRQIDVTSTVELYLTPAPLGSRTHFKAHIYGGTDYFILVEKKRVCDEFSHILKIQSSKTSIKTIITLCGFF